MSNDIKILQGDVLERLKKFPDNHFSALFSDPPYGLGEIKDINGMIYSWLQEGIHKDEHVDKGGFMGKSWDNC